MAPGLELREMLVDGGELHACSVLEAAMAAQYSRSPVSRGGQWDATWPRLKAGHAIASCGSPPLHMMDSGQAGIGLSLM